LKNEYRQFGYELEVIHHTQYIEQLIKENKIKPNKGTDKKYTYHDSCYLGRYNNIYDSPRSAIKNVPGLQLTEMKRSRDKGFCCGAGGGRMFMEEKEGKRVNIERIEEIISTNSDVVASACPFCMTMLSDGIKEKEKSDEIKIKDISEVIWESL
jgi:Fe-S oxidoreductase